MQQETRERESLDGLIVCRVIRPMTDRIAREVLMRTDFAEAHYMSILAMIMGAVGAFALIDPLSLWSAIVGAVVILLALILNEAAWSIERRHLSKGVIPPLHKQIVAWYIATPIVIQLALLLSLSLRLSTYPPQEGDTGVSGWLYMVVALAVVALYLYQLLVEYFVRYYRRSMEDQLEKHRYTPLFAYRYSRDYQAISAEASLSKSSRRRSVYTLLMLWERLFPWHHRLQSLLYRYAHESGVPAQFVRQMPESKRGVCLTLSMLNDYYRWLLLILTLSIRWELWYLLTTGLLLTLCTVGIHYYLEHGHRKLYKQLLGNLRRDSSAEG